MKIFNYFQHINLTNDQQKALEMLHAFLESKERVFILQGYAGSGKTTLLKGFVAYLQSLEKNYQLMAPTGRAAKVINQKTGFESTTIHKGIYSFAELSEIKEEGYKNNVSSFLYQFKIRTDQDVYNSIFIVDEASMVSDVLSEGEFFRFGSGFLLRDLFTFSRLMDSATTSKIIFIGDPAQLPPIGMNFSPALDPAYLKEKYDITASQIEMREVKRQDANNGILLAATKIRRCLTSGYFNDFDLSENAQDIFNPAYGEFLQKYKSKNGKKIIICYKNKSAQGINNTIRKDKYGEDLSIQNSDIIIIGHNNYHLGLMNGEFAVVVDVNPIVESREVRFKAKGGGVQSVKLIWRSIGLLLPDENNNIRKVAGYVLENFLYGDNLLKPEEQRALYLDFIYRHPDLKNGSKEFKEAILHDKYFNCILLKYGYAVTCHKAQGGEWDNAFVFWDRGIQDNFNFYESEHNHTGKTNADFYRWAYTAVTRASKNLFCINPPRFSSFSSMTFVENNVKQAINELTGKQTPSVEINVNDVLPEMERLKVSNEPLTIQDHFIQIWYDLQKHNIVIEEWHKIGYEVRYIFKSESQTAAFKYWVNGQNIFKNNFQKLPAQTTSDELFETIAKILKGATPIIVNRNNAEGILTQIEFDVHIEETKPFLKNLFEALNRGLVDHAEITNIRHLEYRERYTFEKNGNSCVIDFEYDGDGFFGRVLPVENKCINIELHDRIKAIVKNLKEADYVI